ncbi:hypothetical protein EMIHUDRAFT_226764 [Emiliania huxleyi CCMP1516]|uniref:TIR domain-containing protein n=2 Tax=Emiliania huxleyi TaxID=2903 RepID=A0A0D3KK86_EMIH1|nr:hypothetical protein EMIHUDRAFT_226764 [Emiliania huxleyi CCMP1516]EOD36171.1 hypothetical protein EMIHUDRAFT_226764 [Emiliania huxleyi CCMP1516]|eukprot:XP_005788600.1 hypothetical protein EMIHUDRAFT_226764 [Emiliania huxleyi CCMP1516]
MSPALGAPNAQRRQTTLRFEGRLGLSGLPPPEFGSPTGGLSPCHGSQALCRPERRLRGLPAIGAGFPPALPIFRRSAAPAGGDGGQQRAWRAGSAVGWHGWSAASTRSRAGEHERAASRSRGAAPRMDALGSVEKDPGASASTRTAEAPAVAARQTRANSAQLALEPIALSNRLETMLLGNHPVPAPSNEVSVASEVSNSIILVAKAAVDALFSSPQRAALMALGLRDLKPAALAYLVWDLRGVLAGARHDQAVAAASVRFRRSGSRGSVALLLLLPFLPASWDLWCGGEVVLSSAPYTGSDQASGEPFQTEYGVSLSPGVECELHMYDSYGDGWNGASWSGLGQEGLTFAAGLEERKYFVAVAHTPQDIQDEINEAVDQGRNATVYVPPGASLAFKSDVECDGNIHLSVRSSGEGATLDGKKNSRMFYIKQGCSLYLEALHFVDGRGVYGGAVEARNAGDIAMKDVSFTGCEADLHGGAMFVHLSGDVSMESAGFSSCTSAKGVRPLTPRLHGALVQSGGAMKVVNSGDVFMNGANFSECTASYDGAAMYVLGSGDVSLEGASFVGCAADNQAALYLLSIERLALTNSQFLKILFGFYQICTVLSSTYSARLPEEYTGWTDRLANAMSIDWSGVFLPEQCLGYGMRLLAIALSPVALIALLMGTGIALRLHYWRAAPPPRERSWFAEAALGLLDLTPAGLVLVFCFVPSISASIFRSWSCQAPSRLMTAAYTVSPPNEPLEQVSYMRQDASIECGTEDHESITDVAIGLIVLWPVGSLVLFTSLLAACYKPLQAKTPNALTRATAFLHREYETTYFWWEAVELARKLVLTGFVLLIPEENAFLRLVVATLVCSCYAVALAVVRPYKRVGDDVLAVATSLVLLLLFLGANWTTIFLGIEERHPDTEEAAAILGFGKLNGVVNSMLVLVAVTLLFFLIGAVVAARRVAMIPTIQLASTKQPPELDIGTGITWHLFLSHIWSTGQDAVGNIKSELQLLVDNLKDIGALEEYIQRSQMILFFLSCGYFRSKARSRRPECPALGILWLSTHPKADPAKGGGTLQVLRGECPEDLQPDIFEKGWTHTIYMRIEEFQRVSLKTIAVLLSSPNYLDRTSLPLCVPGEPESQSLAFAKATLLWASPANAGAQALADEIADAFAGRSLGGLSRVFAKMSSRSSAEARDVSGGEEASVQQQV